MSVRKKFLLAVVGVAAVSLPIVVGVLRLQAQSQATPQWEIAAGRKMAFDVASVKINKSSDGVRSYSNVTMDPGNEDPPNGGLFSATNFLL